MEFFVNKGSDRFIGLCYNNCRRDFRLLPAANVAQSVEQLIRNQQVRGSSPLVGSTSRGVAQFGSAFGSGPKGRRFKSCHLDQDKDFREIEGLFFFAKKQDSTI